MSGYYYKYTVINDPLAVDETTANGINDSGQIVGIYTDSSSTAHGFLYSNGTYTTFNVPGATNTQAFGINNRGQIVGQYGDRGHAFLMRDGIYITIDIPGALASDATGINDDGQIVGYYVDASDNLHSFLATPVAAPIPEPSTLALLGLGSLGFLVRRRFATKFVH